MSEKKFDISLPSLYKDNWREAYRADKDDSPRLSSYQAPDGEPIPFIYKSLEFSGGQSVDTAEYPFNGLWSNEALNQKTQNITVHGFLRGEYYMKKREELLTALMVPTSDDAPGFFDHPLWGRFKVVVESYNVQEAANENGQCELALTFKRAGVSLEKRAQEINPREIAKPEETVAAAVKVFAEKDTEEKMDKKTLLQGFNSIKGQLININGILRLPQNVLNNITNEITGITNLIAQGIESPLELAKALVNSAFSIAAAAVSTENSVLAVVNYFSDFDNLKTAALNFLSVYNKSLPIETSTVRQAETKESIENLYRAVSLCAAAEIMMDMENVTRCQMEGYWALYTKLENSINLEDPDMYEAFLALRCALSMKLKQNVLNNELKKQIEKPTPLLFLAHYLDCEEDQLRAMNFIEDSLLVSGEVSYV